MRGAPRLSGGQVEEARLAEWMEEPDRSYFRRDVIWPMHRDHLIDVDEGSGLIHLSPLGAERIGAYFVARLRQSAATARVT